MIESFSIATFSERLGEPFHLHLGSGEVLVLELTNASALGIPRAGSSAGTSTGAPTPVREEKSFSLLFRGPDSRQLPQATYEFEHPEIGSFPLFIVPVKADQDGIYYEAIFNRLPDL